MAVTTEGLISFTLEKMQQRLTSQDAVTSGTIKSVQSGLIYAGNIHDSIPRQLLLDSRLSPIDKVTWMMIRLYALQNEGAIFPTYDELQLQLASPNSGKASRETVSRVLLMLRITGWLSLCKRVRDSSGCIRGNIYMQHDEPISAFDAETLDPYWLDTLERAACENKNKSIQTTAINTLQEVRNDPLMKHQHSRIKIIENRLGVIQTPQQLATEQEQNINISYSEILPPTENRTKEKTLQKTLGSNLELSKSQLSSNSELSYKSMSYSELEKSNHYVRNITHSVKETYVSEDDLFFSDTLSSRMSEKDNSMLLEQLVQLSVPIEQKKSILEQLESGVASGTVKNIVAYGLTLLKSAREGRYSYSHMEKVNRNKKIQKTQKTQKIKVDELQETKERKATPNHERIKEQIFDIKKKLSGLGN
ncbi:STY4528 family pathogenicity island replication protein [Xenorhabdus koppenhoeferi]|uniref:Helix-turn-helix domain-containing protein n=1 Tax=Xenorhabdus koppenhoeferi TaxID=351659 RepID=A0A1I7H581_9GAMM|nr:STY4528 family pathogenicity island replication protein [Xenorhabdus koppenhoeferi]CEE94252.1 conserved hypothetical protein [Xenorhabdus nematophila str. Anatoliense]SFU55838.1 Helix-turn-helix domain-containing protein [Xenorhabdus koppenhoeferi]